MEVVPAPFSGTVRQLLPKPNQGLPGIREYSAELLEDSGKRRFRESIGPGKKQVNLTRGCYRGRGRNRTQRVGGMTSVDALPEKTLAG